jgi:hypothetical protein
MRARNHSTIVAWGSSHARAPADSRQNDHAVAWLTSLAVVALAILATLT